MAAQPNLAWDRSLALLGALCAVPAAIVALDDVSHGLALAVGVLPAALVGIAPRRRARVVLAVFGALVGVSMFLGSLLAEVPVLAVAAIFGFGIGSALLAARAPAGMIVMTLALPLVGIGFSFDDVGDAAEILGLMAAGGVYACAVSMLWPESEPVQRPAAPGPTLEYGIRLGAAGATAAAIGFIADLDHVGWATGAALLVMRPNAEMQRLRSVGRIVSVATGAVLAIAFVRAEPEEAWFSVAIVAALTAAAATRASHWYVTPAFTTYLVFLLLLFARPQDAASRFGERVGETLLGVGIAFVFGLLVPAIAARRAGTGSSAGAGTAPRP